MLRYLVQTSFKIGILTLQFISKWVSERYFNEILASSSRIIKVETPFRSVSFHPTKVTSFTNIHHAFARLFVSVAHFHPKLTLQRAPMKRYSNLLCRFHNMKWDEHTWLANFSYRIMYLMTWSEIKLDAITVSLIFVQLFLFSLPFLATVFYRVKCTYKYSFI